MALEHRDKYGRLDFFSPTNNPEDYARLDEVIQSARSYGGNGDSPESATQDSIGRTGGFFAGNGNAGRKGNPTKWW